MAKSVTRKEVESDIESLIKECDVLINEIAELDKKGIKLKPVYFSAEMRRRKQTEPD
jgi:hypothetical protein